MAQKYDITIEQYTDYVKILTFYSDDCGTPKDLSNLSFLGDIRNGYAVQSVVIASISAFAINASGGVMELFIPKEATMDWTFSQGNNANVEQAKVGVYDINQVDQNGVTTRLIEGDVILKRSATRR